MKILLTVINFHISPFRSSLFINQVVFAVIVSIDRVHPALTSHQITVKFPSVEPLVFQLNWPVPVDGATFSIGKKNGNSLLKLILKKSFTDPLPNQYGGRSKWDPDRLIPWRKDAYANGTIQGLLNVKYIF